MEWIVSKNLVPYMAAINTMAERVRAVQQGRQLECVWLLEHPPLYTKGSSAKSSDLLQNSDNLPVFASNRGGQYTYHGPGQRVAYLMLDLIRRERDIRRYVTALEQWIINTLAEFAIQGERRDGRIGIWVSHGGQDKKIAAIGVRLQQWVSSHGIALNVFPKLDHYQGIVPCGLKDYGVTSLHDLGATNITMADVDRVLQEQFTKVPFLHNEVLASFSTPLH
ncbi:MAG: lipoyl(octanoyl) transferase LipB [Alphaproteobacteria bacterium]